MDKTSGERRAETAKQNDDSDIIEAAGEESLPPPSQSGSKGGELQTDIGSRVDEERATDPNRRESVKKGEHIAHGQGSTPPHPARHVVTERSGD
jgi:hypothetical protein